MADVDPIDWSASDKITVSYPNTDTTILHSIDVVARFNSHFEYDKLNLILCTVAPDGRRWNDTLSVAFRNEMSMTQHYVDAEQPLRTNVQLRQKGDYLFIFSQLMPTSDIKGVAALGVNIKTLFEI